MIKIAFVLPRPSVKIVGGYKTVYNYANHLASIGKYNVSIIYDCHTVGTRFRLKSSIIKKQWGKALYKKAKWYKLSDKVKIEYAASEVDLDKTQYDLLIATALNTANTVANAQKAIQKAYLIQGFENWSTEDAAVYESYRLPMIKIVVAKWLKDLVAQYDNTGIYYCSNGINTKVFNILESPEARKNHSICFLFHEDEIKGMATLKPVLDRLKKEYPDLIVNSFGSFERPIDWPIDNYISFANEIQLRDLYNKSAIFVCSSYEEGFGLTGAESMACGCALVTTDTNGSREYANANNSIICKVKDEMALYESIKGLLEDKEKRCKLAKQGNKDIAQKNLEQSMYDFERIIEEIVAR